MFVDIEKRSWQPAPGHSDRPIFSIGDIHGRFDLLQPLLSAIRGFAEEEAFQAPCLVLLGDYVSRGPHALRVLRQISMDDPIPGFEVICLPGNHEQMMLAFLSAEADLHIPLATWLDNGGDRVAVELGLSVREAYSDPPLFHAKLCEFLGEHGLNFLTNLPLYWRHGRYLFVHGGIHPAIGLKNLASDWKTMPNTASEEDLDPLWIRGPFLTHEGQHEDGLVVVHGHTPHDEPEILPNRINLDTRAFQSGRLTAACLWQDRIRIVQAVGDRHERARGWL